MIARAILVLAAALIQSHLALAASSEAKFAIARTGGIAIRLEVPDGWKEAPKSSGRISCDAKPLEETRVTSAPGVLSEDCFELSGAVLVLMSSGAGGENTNVRIITKLHARTLQDDMTMRSYIDRQKECVWPYASGQIGNSLRCVTGLPMGSAVQSVELDSADLGKSKMTLLEYRGVADSTPLWAAAYIPLGRDVLQIIFRPRDEQSYRLRISDFRRVITSLSTEKEEAK
jgi:hypothetical protein